MYINETINESTLCVTQLKSTAIIGAKALYTFEKKNAFIAILFYKRIANQLFVTRMWYINYMKIPIQTIVNHYSILSETNMIIFPI